MTPAVDPRLSLVEAASPAAARLAELASLAVRVDTGLLRRLRQVLLPDADVGAESDLWFSAIVESRSETGFQIAPEVVAQLRDRLISRPNRPAVALVRAIVADAHATVSPAIRLEEEINGIALEHGHAGRPAIDEALRPALGTLARGGPDAMDIARWAVHAVRRLHPIVRESQNARTLILSASLLLRGRARLVGGSPEPNVRISTLAWAVPGGVRSQRLGVEFVPGGLQFRTPSDTVGRIDVPITEPVVVEIEWESGGTPRRRLTQAADGVLVALNGDPQAVTITTLLGDQFQVTSSPTGSQAAGWRAVFPPESLLEACVQVEPLGRPDPICVAFAVDETLLVSVSERIAPTPILGVHGDLRQLEVMQSQGYDLVCLRPVSGEPLLYKTTLPPAIAAEDSTLRVATAGFVGGKARWYDVALEPLTEATGNIRRGALFNPSHLSEEELVAAFVGAPLVANQRAVGAIVRVRPPQPHESYAQIDVVSATHLNEVLERARQASRPEGSTRQQVDNAQKTSQPFPSDLPVALLPVSAREAISTLIRSDTEHVLLVSGPSQSAIDEIVRFIKQLLENWPSFEGTIVRIEHLHGGRELAEVIAQRAGLNPDDMPRFQETSESRAAGTIARWLVSALERSGTPRILTLHGFANAVAPPDLSDLISHLIASLADSKGLVRLVLLNYSGHIPVRHEHDVLRLTLDPVGRPDVDRFFTRLFERTGRPYEPDAVAQATESVFGSFESVESWDYGELRARLVEAARILSEDEQ